MTCAVRRAPEAAWPPLCAACRQHELVAPRQSDAVIARARAYAHSADHNRPLRVRNQQRRRTRVVGAEAAPRHAVHLGTHFICGAIGPNRGWLLHEHQASRAREEWRQEDVRGRRRRRNSSPEHLLSDAWRLRLDELSESDLQRGRSDREHVLALPQVNRMASVNLNEASPPESLIEY